MFVVLSAQLFAVVANGATEKPGDATDQENPGSGTPPSAFIDRTQRRVNNLVLSSSQWFDSFFGSTEVNRPGNVRRGSLRVGAQWDERDGTRFIGRFKARLPLPALQERSRLILGRGDADEFIDGSTTGTTDALPSQFNDFEDDEWLFGLGYSRNARLARGFDFSAGIKVSSPIEHTCVPPTGGITPSGRMCCGNCAPGCSGRTTGVREHL